VDHVLLLNADHTPIRTVSWQRAIELVLDGRVVVVAVKEDAAIRSERLSLPWPSVIALVRYAPVFSMPAPTRRHVLARDGHACVYCGASAGELSDRPPHERLTLDHVVPRCRSRHGFVTVPWSGVPVPVSGWLNLVTACGRCNGRKGDRTPEEAGLTLPRSPWKPTRRDLLRPAPSRPFPAEWLPWLPAAA
jgi:5-methylcytosine-specific restriction endonuclease McrA